MQEIYVARDVNNQSINQRTYKITFYYFYFSISCPLSCFISVYHALYLDTFTSQELIGKLAKLYSVASQQIAELYCSGPSGIYILTTNEVIHVVILWKYTNCHNTVWDITLQITVIDVSPILVMTWILYLLSCFIRIYIKNFCCI